MQALIPLALLGAFAGSAPDYVPTYTNPATFDACGAAGVGSILNIIGTSTAGTLGSGNNRYVGGRIGYATGPLELAGAYSRTRIPGNDDLRVWNVGASFKLGVAKLSALYHRGDHDPSGLPKRKRTVWAIGANLQRATFAPAVMGKASGNRSDGPNAAQHAWCRRRACQPTAGGTVSAISASSSSRTRWST